mmetsp:Transcript_19498/g.54379  ORF Transcript_19498/g.54379 Transcript_19498/m.54379 type:complete len:103 (+) Transcript_19498:2955-3263(+)
MMSSCGLGRVQLNAIMLNVHARLWNHSSHLEVNVHEFCVAKSNLVFLRNTVSFITSSKFLGGKNMIELFPTFKKNSIPFLPVDSFVWLTVLYGLLVRYFQQL